MYIKIYFSRSSGCGAVWRRVRRYEAGRYHTDNRWVFPRDVSGQLAWLHYEAFEVSENSLHSLVVAIFCPGYKSAFNSDPGSSIQIAFTCQSLLYRDGNAMYICTQIIFLFEQNLFITLFVHLILFLRDLSLI